MSGTETHVGKLRKLHSNLPLEEWCKELILLKEGNLPKLPKYYNDYVEFFRDEYYKEYSVINNIIYEIFEHEEVDPDGYFKIKKIDEDTFSFMGSFYNGGTCLEEVLEGGLEKLTKSGEDSILF